MERICTHCGTPLEANALFCPECGERAPAPAADLPQEEIPAVQPEAPAPVSYTASSAESPASAAPAFAPAAAAPFAASGKPVHTAPVPEVTEPETVTVYNRPLSAATYFWTLFLFGIPAVGLIVMLIMAFTAKNRNRRNFAQACLIYVLIGLILLGLFMLVLVVSGKSFGIDISRFSFKTIWEGILQGIGFVK